MANANTPKRALIEGKAALIVIDIQASTFIDDSVVRSIDNMPGYKERMLYQGFWSLTYFGPISGPD